LFAKETGFLVFFIYYTKLIYSQYILTCEKLKRGHKLSDCDNCPINEICRPETHGWVPHNLAYLGSCTPLNMANWFHSFEIMSETEMLIPTIVKT
jgi:hypothetical protein